MTSAYWHQQLWRPKVLHDEFQRLSARLPELEWKLNTLDTGINPALLPRGLFRNRLEMTAQSCVDEIKEDLRSLKQQKNDQTELYIAERVGKKINVLVRLCQQNIDKPALERQGTFGIHAISTRQQWLKTMQHDIDVLQAQHDGLAATLMTLKAENNIQAILNLQTELGEATRRLTLAKETLARSTI